MSGEGIAAGVSMAMMLVSKLAFGGPRRKVTIQET